MDYFYHAEAEESLTVGPDCFEVPKQNSDPAIYLKVSSVLFVRAGLFLSHVSSIPSSNIQILIFQNIIDIAVNTVLYAAVGYLFAFGEDVGAFVGIDGFLGNDSNRNEFAEGWLVLIAVSGLLVAAIGDRVSFFASLILNGLLSAFVLPVGIHWILSDSGWLRVNTLARIRVSYKDYSYACLIHMSGGFLAFISMLILNKRLLRFKDMDVCSIPDNGPSLTLFGNLFMLIGFFGIGIPTQKYILSHLNYNFYGIVLVNMLVSAFGAILMTLILTFSCPCEPMHKWTSMRSIQAGISGIAIVAGGADLYLPMVALLMGLLNGIVFFFTSYVVNNSPIEDYSNIIACHFVSGLLGTLMPPILGIREGFQTTAYNSFIHFLWQLIGDLAMLCLIIGIFLPVALLLDYFSVLRSWDEDINHRRALFASNSVKNGALARFFTQQQSSEPAVNYVQEGSTPNVKKLPPNETSGQMGPEKVDVIFEKKASPPPFSPIDENPEVAACSSNDKPNAKFNQMNYKLNNQNFLVNYVVNSKPMTFFEEINIDTNHPSDIMVKDCGDSFGNARFIDLRLMKGIRNISDSKLFQKFKDNWTVPKKRMIWNRERELKVGSVSNFRVPSSTGLTVETQV